MVVDSANECAERINFDIAQQTEKIRNGTHTELLRRKESLVRGMEKRIAIADRFRKLQLRNVNQLHDFEIDEAKSAFQVWYYFCSFSLIE